MKFIQMINEASSLQLGDLKKALKKDDKVSAALSKQATLDDIKDKESFLSSLKYWIFNNENVRQFVKDRANTGKMDTWSFNHLKKLKASELNTENLDIIKEFVSDLFKDITAVSNLTVSNSTKKELSDFINSNTRYHGLSYAAQKELSSIPGLKPTSPIVVYRGLLFSEYSLVSRKSYDGTLDKGQGLKFLESVRKGGKIVDLEWDRPSSWSLSKEVATRFAKYGPASSSMAATMQWLSREASKKQIDGALGFVIATRIKPEDILLDVEKLYGKLSMAHGDEREIIIKPGTYTCRIIHKYTPSGEVEVDMSDTSKKQILDAIVSDLSKVEKIIPDDYDDLAETRHIPLYDMLSILRDAQLAKKLATNGTTTAVIHSYNKAMPLIRDALIAFKEIDVSHFASSEDDRVKFENIKSIFDTISEKIVTVVDGKKEVNTALNADAELFRNSDSWIDLGYFERDYLTRGRLITDTSAKFMVELAVILGVDTPKPHILKQSGPAKQEVIIQKVIDSFFLRLGITAPENKTDRAKLMITILRKIGRNRKMMVFLARIDKKLKELKQPVSINTSEPR